MIAVRISTRILSIACYLNVFSSTIFRAALFRETPVSISLGNDRFDQFVVNSAPESNQ